jgi:hypothetical protein
MPEPRSLEVRCKEPWILTWLPNFRLHRSCVDLDIAFGIQDFFRWRAWSPMGVEVTAPSLQSAYPWNLTSIAEHIR